MKPQFWKGRTTFVTGATGLVGGWLVKRLLRSGADVVALMRDSVPGRLLARERLEDRIVVVRGVLEDLPLLRRTLAEYAVDTVFHLGAQTQVGVAKRDPIGTLEANVRGTWNLLEACRELRVPAVVVASSDKAYGQSENLPYREDEPLRGRYPYDCSKSCADLITTMYASTYGLNAAIARCGNIFGGGDLNFNRLFPELIRATLRGERFVIRSDGRFVRDLLYVKDAAGAYMRLAEKLRDDPALAGEAFNFSLEVKCTVLELVDRVLAAMHRSDLEPEIQNCASSEIREQYMSCAKARALLGWAPEYGLDAAIYETIDWYAAYFGKHESRPAAAAAGRNGR